VKALAARLDGLERPPETPRKPVAVPVDVTRQEEAAGGRR